jgi:uncharacterized protein (DUF1015 family)
VPRFEPFAGLRYRATDLSAVVCPPYDVISDDEQAALEAADPYNAVRLELPRDEPGRDRYASAAARLAEWLAPGGPLVADDRPAFYGYRMSFTDEAGVARATSGVIGALGIEPPGEGDVLPHERTTPKAKSDRLELLRATRVNLSPVWGLSLAPGLTGDLAGSGPAAVVAVDAAGVRHELWLVDDVGAQSRIAAAVGSAPVVIADGHHRYEVAATYKSEVGAGGNDPAASVMAFVVELSADQLTVAAIHRVIAGLPRDFDLLRALDEWFELRPTDPVDAGITDRMVRDGALAVVTPAGAWLARPRPETVAAATHDLDSSRLDVALARLPEHHLTYQHGVQNVTGAIDSGAAQAGILLRPATVEQIAAVAHARDRMPPKTTFFTPKPATGLVFRPVGAVAAPHGGVAPP